MIHQCERKVKHTNRKFDT